MAIIDKHQGALFKRLMQEEGWAVLEQALANRIARLQAQPISGTTAFESLRALHTRDGKVEGLREFFDDIEKMAFDD
jgi:hypothetical protein